MRGVVGQRRHTPSVAAPLGMVTHTAATSARTGQLLRLPGLRRAILELPLANSLPCLPPEWRTSRRNHHAAERRAVRARALACLMVAVMVPILLRVFRAAPESVPPALCRVLALLPTVRRLLASAALRELAGEPLPVHLPQNTRKNIRKRVNSEERSTHCLRTAECRFY